MDPANIESFEEWILYYRAGNINLKLDKLGQYLVYDTKLKEIVKIIPPLPKGADYGMLLATTTNSDLRGAAEATRHAIMEARATRIREAEIEYLKTEQTLLQESDAWGIAKKAGDHAGCHAKALLIGMLTVELRQKEKALQEARYAIRYVPKVDRELQRSLLDIDTHDPRKINIVQLIQHEVKVQDRVVSLVPAAAAVAVAPI
jgi:hypothetical protein